MSKAVLPHQYDYIFACSPVPTFPSTKAVFLLTFASSQFKHGKAQVAKKRFFVDRRPIDPPPIVQIKLENPTSQETQDFLQNPYFFMNVHLIHPSTEDEIFLPSYNVLSGQTVSSMYKLKDIDNHDGGFFVFGDLSVKVEGQYRLKFSLFEITM
ncbi:hypothetical protein DFQ30_006455 [Apophysomyces sp. BC1015]|nr:hypothetical protein DFQ30_006455 [Apophysomyces sp. BC1015]